jgi:hypothetical protein
MATPPKRRRSTPDADVAFRDRCDRFLRRFDALTDEAVRGGRWSEVQRVHRLLIAAMDGAVPGVQYLAILHLALQAVGHMIDGPEHPPDCPCHNEEV